MFSLVDKRIVAGFVASFILLIIILFFSYRGVKLFQATSDKVAHTHVVLHHIERIYSQVLEIESNQRGYLIFADESFEEQYHPRVSSIYLHLDTLRSHVSDDSQQYARSDSLRKLLEKKIEFTKDAMEAMQYAPDSVKTMVASLEGKRLSDAIYALTQRMQAHEKLLLNERIAAGEATMRNLYIIFFLFCTIILLIFFGVILVVRARMRERFEAERKIGKASETVRDLYDNAPCGYHSLDAEGYFVEANLTFLQWTGYNKEELLGKLKFSDLLTEPGGEMFRQNFARLKEQGRINGVEYQLRRKDGSSFYLILNSTAVYNSEGQYIQSRSSTFDISPRKAAEEKAKFLNSELEAFSYSVSHDLRAPLRSIDSYTKILEMDYSPVLDDEGRRILKVVLQSTSRMNGLIDDLLDFSHLARKELLKTKVDMNRLVEEVLAEMKEETNGREVNVHLEKLQPGLADRNMVRQVWVNLLSNALKYTRQREVAEIRIGYLDDKEQGVYFIKDNGAGFDMRYYDKLFGVFKRLHSHREFEGTGVGLALCHRIVARHGGRIWAEAEVDKGASFYFTLQESA